MELIFVHVVAPVITGVIVAFIVHWLNKRNKNRRP